MRKFYKWAKFGMLISITTAVALPTMAQSPAAVASADAYASKVAQEVLLKGGNAVDAAVATAFTLAVTYPEAGNIGGGGFMLIYFKGEPYFLDYREVAPIAATANMYLDDSGEVIENMSLVGIKAAGVPGTVLGLWEAHQKFGVLPWEDLVSPAIAYAEHGFVVGNQLSLYGDAARESFAGKTNFEQHFSGLQSGLIFKQPELAQTLQRIAKNGADEFYRGHTAELLIEQMQRDGGIITKEDLDAYEVKWRTPINFTWRGKEVLTAPPPSSGGIALAQLLMMQEQHINKIKNYSLNSVPHIHFMAELEKRVYADRAEYLGDPDFYQVPVEKLIDESYIQKRAGEVNFDKISETEEIKPGLENHQTTHFSILDFEGNAVSNTYTLNYDFGNGVVVEGAGFLLNNEMDDFSAKPGVMNIYGVVGGDANAIAPQKRMLSSMTPTIVVDNGEVALVVGTPGGSRIITSVFQVLSNVFVFEMPLDKAVNAQRVHHQLLPKDTIFYDAYAPIDDQQAKGLAAMGYQLEDQGWNMGDIQAILSRNGQVHAVSDARGRGKSLVIIRE
ncbi:gamma-glutamyltransferase [Thorsellia kenyensis]|uniref:Glutathione hydrolase proenzyme n=1 Tax=Thorsellia kenyensis TaxID=1549888 RepID=A0ABV6CBT3_9GAMM